MRSRCEVNRRSPPFSYLSRTRNTRSIFPRRAPPGVPYEVFPGRPARRNREESPRSDDPDASVPRDEARRSWTGPGGEIGFEGLCRIRKGLERLRIRGARGVGAGGRTRSSRARWCRVRWNEFPQRRHKDDRVVICVTPPGAPGAGSGSPATIGRIDSPCRTCAPAPPGCGRPPSALNFKSFQLIRKPYGSELKPEMLTLSSPTAPSTLDFPLFASSLSSTRCFSLHSPRGEIPCLRCVGLRRADAPGPIGFERRARQTFRARVHSSGSIVSAARKRKP